MADTVNDYVLMRSPSGTVWRMTVDDDGEIVVQAQGTLSASVGAFAPSKAAAILGKK